LWAIKRNGTAAASGNRPTGPFVNAAAATPAPDTTPQPIARLRSAETTPSSAAHVAAVVKNAIVVSRRLFTMAHDTTGTAIHSRTGRHSRRPGRLPVPARLSRTRGTAPFCWSSRHIATIATTVAIAVAREYARSTYR